jgi:hypothetical protein
VSLAGVLGIKPTPFVFRLVACPCGDQAWHAVPLDGIDHIVRCYSCRKSHAVVARLPASFRS